MSILGNPQDTIHNIVHIAGTNGKGSTIAFLESLLRESGFNVAKYTSPHLINLTERYQINGEKINEKEFNSLYSELEKYNEFNNLTYFEKLTAIAFKYFAEKQKNKLFDILLLETGLGGRLDATNCINPILSLITNIGFDHQEFLGNTIEKIAFEKAGILKENTPFITTVSSDAYKVIARRAQNIKAEEINMVDYDINSEKLGLLGTHQIENAKLALRAFDFLYRNLKNKEFETSRFYDAIYKAQDWPGRFQIIDFKGKTFILDGAHNIEAATCLRQSLDKVFPNRNRFWLLGFIQNKQFSKITKTLLKEQDSVVFTLADSESNSVNPEYLLEQLSDNFNCKTEKNQIKAFDEIFKDMSTNDICIISGSLYLVGRILESLENKNRFNHH